MAEFAPNILFHVGFFPVTNTIISTLLVDSVLIGAVIYLKRSLHKIPEIFQNVVEMLMETFYNLTESIAGNNTKKIFPWFMTFFLFILIGNWSGLIPGIGTFGIKETVDHKEVLIPFIRNFTSDLNATLGLAIISLIATHVLSIQAVGIKEYLSRFFSFNPILLFVGLLELISEFTKIVSLSFRLFGNIFAGEVVLTTISNIFSFIFPVPFLLLEIIVGLVQALVFSMLTMVFMSVLMTPHHVEEKLKAH